MPDLAQDLLRRLTGHPDGVFREGQWTGALLAKERRREEVDGRVLCVQRMGHDPGFIPDRADAQPGLPSLQPSEATRSSGGSEGQGVDERARDPQRARSGQQRGLGVKDPVDEELSWPFRFERRGGLSHYYMPPAVAEIVLGVAGRDR